MIGICNWCSKKKELTKEMGAFHVKNNCCSLHCHYKMDCLGGK